jgi:ethanolamine transporter EutH
MNEAPWMVDVIAWVMLGSMMGAITMACVSFSVWVALCIASQIERYRTTGRVWKP